MSALHTHAARALSFRRFAAHNPHDGWWRRLPTNVLHVAAAAYATDDIAENHSRVAMLRAFVTGPLTAERLAVAAERNPMPYGKGYAAIYDADPSRWAGAEVIDATYRLAEHVIADDRDEALMWFGYARSRAALVVLHAREKTDGTPVNLTTGGRAVYPLIDASARRVFRVLQRKAVSL